MILDVSSAKLFATQAVVCVTQTAHCPAKWACPAIKRSRDRRDGIRQGP
jgi:hypothetical protein